MSIKGLPMFFKEWTLQPNQRRGCMLPISRFATICKAPDAGYSSVYMFDAEAARQILDAQSSIGLDRYPVYTDTLTLDLDDGDRQLERAKQVLSHLGLGYEIWSSGGKGYHLIISLTAMVSGKDVPYSQRKWVEALGIGADLTLYQHGRLISLPGRKHPKTGKQKVKKGAVKGKRLELPMLIRPTVTFVQSGPAVGELEAGLWKAVSLLQSEPSPGNRHVALWSTAKHFADAGLEYDTTLDLLTAVNELWENPKAPDELQIAVIKAYKNYEGT